MTESELINIAKKASWSVQGFNGMPLYLHCAATESAWLTNKKFGPSYTHFIYLFSKGRAYMYYDEKDWERMSKLFYEQVQSEHNFEILKKEYYRTYKSYTDNAKYGLGTLQKATDTELITLTKNVLERLVYATNFAHVIEGVTFGSEQTLKEALTKRGEHSETDFSLLCSPVAPSFLSQAQQKLRRIRDAEEKDDLIKEYLRDFEWVQTTYLGPKVLTKSDVLTQAEALPKESAGIDYKEITKTKEKIIQKYTLGPKERFVIRMVELCFAWQDDRKMHILQSIYHAEPVLQEVSRRFNIPLMPLKFSLPHEFTQQNLSDPTFRKTLEDRCKKSAHYVTEEGYKVFTSSAFDTVASALHVTLTDEVKELRGTPASKGRAEGRVRICDSVSDIDTFEEGDILVTSMTRPEFLPAMQKAVAFVTNEGGVTCHAAIVSREMNKPCIIGTKNATQVLKDGEMVEVDADNGVVRRIKK